MKVRRQRLLDGEINCLPPPFQRFSNDFMGIEQGKYYLVTASTKIGKSQLGRYIFVFSPILYAYSNPEKVKYTVFYYSWEETPEVIIQMFMSHLLYILSEGTIRIDLNELNSVREPVPEEVLKFMERPDFVDRMKFFEDNVHFMLSRNPTGINKEMRDYAQSRGIIHRKEKLYKDKITQLTQKTDAFDWYEPENPKEYKIIFIDHLSLLGTEQGLSLKQSIDKLSQEYLVQLRNWYGFTPVVIQQQMADIESNDNFKIGKLKPSLLGLADSKYPGRDCNTALSLLSPFRYDIERYKDYDITKFRDHIRFMEVLANRNGIQNGICPLYFDGAVNFFAELPLPNDSRNLDNFYTIIKQLEK